MDTQRLLETFLDLVRIDATSDRERPVADYVREFLAPLPNVTISEDQAGSVRGGDSGNLTCRVGAGGTTLLTAHMDTARPTADLRPVVSEDRVTSDGSTILGADNRAGMAAILHTIESLSSSSGPQHEFTAAFLICEEVDLTGSRQLEIPAGIKSAYVMDSSFRPGHYVNRSYGACRWTARVQGRAAHAGVAPERGINAVQLASRAVATLPLGRLDDTTVANVGVMSGGGAVNVVPDAARVDGEVRSLDESRLVSRVDAVENAFIEAARDAGGNAELERFWDFQPYDLAPEEEICRRLETVLAELGLEPRPTVSAGGSDANSFNAKGLVALNVGIGAQNPHGNDEFILLEDLQHAAAIARGVVTS